MSLETAGIEFCKKINSGINCKEILRVVQKLQSSARGLGNKVYPTPMLGLLLYNQERLKKFVGSSAIEELENWEEEDLIILFSAHEQVLRLNEACLASLAKILPEAVPAVNPYKSYPTPASFNAREELLFKWQDAEEIINSFCEHPALDLINRNLSLVKGTNIDYNYVVSQLNTELVESGPGGEPEWVRYMKDAYSFDESPVPLYVFVGLLCLHNSLSNLDQLIFQALFSDELFDLERGRIIDYLWTTKGPGPAMWLMQLPNPYLYFLDPGDIIKVSIEKPDIKGGLSNRLCSIHAQTIPGTMMTPGVLEMRMIDENLNSYTYLLPSPISRH